MLSEVISWAFVVEASAKVLLLLTIIGLLSISYEIVMLSKYTGSIQNFLLNVGILKRHLGCLEGAFTRSKRLLDIKLILG